MTPLETMLTNALLANAKLREESERLIAAYVAPESDGPASIDGLIRMFDGPSSARRRGFRRRRCAPPTIEFG
jgi:hypothetical protein